MFFSLIQGGGEREREGGGGGGGGGGGALACLKRAQFIILSGFFKNFSVTRPILALGQVFAR